MALKAFVLCGNLIRLYDMNRSVFQLKESLVEIFINTPKKFAKTKGGSFLRRGSFIAIPSDV